MKAPNLHELRSLASFRVAHHSYTSSHLTTHHLHVDQAKIQFERQKDSMEVNPRWSRRNAVLRQAGQQISAHIHNIQFTKNVSANTTTNFHMHNR
jgi:hypothetical protein